MKRAPAGLVDGEAHAWSGGSAELEPAPYDDPFLVTASELGRGRLVRITLPEPVLEGPASQPGKEGPPAR